MKPYFVRAGLVAVFLISFRVLLPDVAPHITAGDSGELALSGVTLGVAHSPGYPLFSQVNKLGGWLLHFGNPAYRQNVLSAFFLSLALVVLGALLVLISGLRWSVALPILVLFSDSFRHHAYVTEVFPLAVFWASLLLYFIVTLRRRSSLRPFLGFIFALGLVIHQTLVLIVPALILFLALGAPKSRRSWGRDIPLVLTFFLLGLTVVFYLPIRSMVQPVLDWEDPETLSRFWGVLTRARYGFFQLSQGAAPHLSLSRLGDVLVYSKNALINNVGWVGLALLFLGSVQSLSKALTRRILAMSWAIILIMGPLFFWYANVAIRGDADIFSRFTLVPLLLVMLLIGLGCTFLWSSKLWLYRGFMMLLLMGFVFENTYIHKKNDVVTMRWDASLREAGLNTLRMIPLDSVLLADRADESEFSFAYLLMGENRRPKTRFIDANAGTTRSIYGDDYYRIWGKPRLARREKIEKSLIESSTVPVFYSTVEPSMVDTIKTPHGLLHKAWSFKDLKESDHFPWDKFVTWRFLPKEKRGQLLYATNANMLGRSFFEAGASEAALKMFGLAEKYGGANRFELMGFWSQIRGQSGPALEYYQKALVQGVKSEAIFSNSGALLVEMGRLPEAIGMYEKGLQYFQNSVDILYNFAVARWQEGQMDSVKSLLQRVLAINPRHEGALSLLARTK